MLGNARGVAHGVEELRVVEDGRAGVPAALELPQVLRQAAVPHGVKRFGFVEVACGTVAHLAPRVACAPGKPVGAEARRLRGKAPLAQPFAVVETHRARDMIGGDDRQAAGPGDVVARAIGELDSGPDGLIEDQP